MPGTQQQPPINIPQPLPLWQVAAYSIAFPLCFSAFITACIGLFVLTGNLKAAFLKRLLAYAFVASFHKSQAS